MTDADIALAERLADAAAAEIRPHFRRLAAVETKADASPVTVADRAAEAAIRAILAAERPADGVIGEEYGEDRPDAPRVWVIDPIDGTRAFVTGRPLFGTLIALLEDGVPVIGVLDQCIGGDRWLGAAGRPTTLGGVPAATRPCAALARAHVGTTSPYLFDDLAAFQRVRAAARDVIYGGDCYNYGLVASGHLDLVVESGLKVYDWAALVPIVTGAGGAMTDWAGEPLRRGSDGRVVAVGDPTLLSAVITMLSP
jgi:histidinol phosphatase-like enzyme (inositol monophosphatase family)